MVHERRFAPTTRTLADLGLLAALALLCALAGTALAAAPKDGEPPEVEVPAGLGVGEDLICASGSWTGGSSISFSYVWLRNGVAISGAKGSFHAIVSADRGTSISCVVTTPTPKAAQNAKARTTSRSP